MLNLYGKDRIDELSDPAERLICAVITQAIVDLRIPGYRKEAHNFFHGPFIQACGIDGDTLSAMASEAIKARRRRRR